jgi:uncharacterized membrane protein (UPF0136 family)
MVIQFLPSQPNQQPTSSQSTQTGLTLIASIGLLTSAVAYIRTGSPQIFSESLPTNTALIIALFTLFGGAIESVRTRSPGSIAAGHVFGALYMLSFAKLRAGQIYGVEFGLLASFVMAVGPILTGWNPLPKELGCVGVYGVVVFGNAFGGFWLTLVLLFSIVILYFRGDLRQIRDRMDQEGVL